MSQDKEPAIVRCRIVHETDKALLIEQGVTQTWIPRSQLDHISKKGKHAKGGFEAEIEMPEWLADDKGVEYA